MNVQEAKQFVDRMRKYHVKEPTNLFLAADCLQARVKELEEQLAYVTELNQDREKDLAYEYKRANDAEEEVERLKAQVAMLEDDIDAIEAAFDA